VADTSYSSDEKESAGDADTASKAKAESARKEKLLAQGKERYKFAMEADRENRTKAAGRNQSRQSGG
jgi:hypothetical protein